MTETSDERRDVYKRWLRFSENLGTWAFEPGASPAEHERQLHDLMAELDLQASPQVRAAVQDYVDHLAEANEAIKSTHQVEDDLDSQRRAAGLAFASAMRPYRDRMVAVMREDVGSV